MLHGKSENILDQHIKLGWLLLKWRLGFSELSNLDDPFAIRYPTPESLAVSVIDPVLSSLYFQAIKDGTESTEKRVNELRMAILSHFKEGSKLILVPIWAPGHWTLLSLSKDAEGEPYQIRYRDSLQELSQECFQRAQLLLSLAEVPAELPDRCNKKWQPSGEGVCGYFVLAYMEHEVKRFFEHSLAAGGYIYDLVDKWRQQLGKLTQALDKELGKLKKEAKRAQDKEAEQLAKKGAAAKAKAKLDAAKAVAEEQAELAAKLLDQGHSLREEDLPEPVRIKLAKLKGLGIKICSKCRWTSGCFECDYEKSLSYHLRKEMPKWLEKKKAEHKELG